MVADSFRIEVPETLTHKFALLLPDAARLPNQREVIKQAERLIEQLFSEEGMRSIMRRCLHNEFKKLITIERINCRGVLNVLEPYLRSGQVDDFAWRRLRESQAAYCVSAPDILCFPTIRLWLSLIVCLALANMTKGTIVDLFSRRIVPNDLSLAQSNVDGLPRVGQFILVPHSLYDDGEHVWITTMGMARFGLPELQVKNVPSSLTTPMTQFVCGCAQMLLVDVLQRIGDCVNNEDGGAHSFEFRNPMRITSSAIEMSLPIELEAEEGHEPYVAFEYQNGRGESGVYLTLLPGGCSADSEEWQSILSHYFFIDDRPVAMLARDHGLIELAKRRAVEEFPEFKRRFVRGELAGSDALVKAGVPHAGGTEFMWFQVCGWVEDRIIAQLESDPQFCSHLERGRDCYVHESVVCDWIIFHPTGDCEGGYTNSVAKLHGQPRE